LSTTEILVKYRHFCQQPKFWSKIAKSIFTTAKPDLPETILNSGHCVVSPVNPNQYPEMYIDEESAMKEPNMELCQSDLCNNRPIYGNGENAQISIILLLFLSFLFV